MERAGVEIHRYHPLTWHTLDRVNNRTHRKLLILDGRVGFTGGVGIAQQWTGNAEDPDHWRDLHFRVDGPAVAHLQAAFMDNWIKTHSCVLYGPDYFPELVAAGDQVAQVFRSSPREGSESMRLMFLLSIACARRTLRIGNAYFVPDDLLVQSLVDARSRGVDVKIIVPGKWIDTALVRRASRSRWGDLLEAGCEIHEFQPTMYHTKLMVVDDVWASVGSTNFDNRSLRLNDEANLNVMDRAFAARLAAEFDADLGRSHRVTLEEWRHRPLREKAIEHLSGLLRSQL
jgi:cardiolipin synthase